MGKFNGREKSFDEGIIWRIDDGCDINVTSDKWLRGYPVRSLPRLVDSRLYGLNVSYFLRDGNWNSAVLKEFFDEKLTNDIFEIPVCIMEARMN